MFSYVRPYTDLSAHMLTQTDAHTYTYTDDQNTHTHTTNTRTRMNKNKDALPTHSWPTRHKNEHTHTRRGQIVPVSAKTHTLRETLTDRLQRASPNGDFRSGGGGGTEGGRDEVR